MSAWEYKIIIETVTLLSSGMQYNTTSEQSVPYTTLMKSKQNTRFPKISSKPKSLPGENRASNNSSLDTLTCKAWLYYTPESQMGYKTNMKR